MFALFYSLKNVFTFKRQKPTNGDTGWIEIMIIPTLQMGWEY
jgi:hypothetical protein